MSLDTLHIVQIPCQRLQPNSAGKDWQHKLRDLWKIPPRHLPPRVPGNGDRGPSLSPFDRPVFVYAKPAKKKDLTGGRARIVTSVFLAVKVLAAKPVILPKLVCRVHSQGNTRSIYGDFATQGVAAF